MHVVSNEGGIERIQRNLRGGVTDLDDKRRYHRRNDIASRWNKTNVIELIVSVNSELTAEQSRHAERIDVQSESDKYVKSMTSGGPVLKVVEGSVFVVGCFNALD